MRTLVLPIVIATTILAHGGPPARPVTATRSAAPVFNRQPLRTEALVPLPLGAVLPRGWLQRQLRIQAEGLTGHLDERGRPYLAVYHGAPPVGPWPWPSYSYSYSCSVFPNYE